ncbi:hypothetical protein LWI29_009437 [Acer saccharum]|uniref:Uncharacterized protein n=1 Tax=Acer saccharum TaxID=4024 RepID=A0AA39RR61_ACESA|nr:hypothetical protein LWI29_009437 [Acer saccharum]
MVTPSSQQISSSLPSVFPINLKWQPVLNRTQSSQSSMPEAFTYDAVVNSDYSPIPSGTSGSVDISDVPLNSGNIIADLPSQHQPGNLVVDLPSQQQPIVPVNTHSMTTRAKHGIYRPKVWLAVHEESEPQPFKKFFLIQNVRVWKIKNRWKTWHEARRSEKTVHDIMDAARNRAQRRGVFMPKRRGDPQQSIQVIGSHGRMYRDDTPYQATQDQQGL